jgi:hypothetical protein
MAEVAAGSEDCVVWQPAVISPTASSSAVEASSFAGLGRDGGDTFMAMG